MIDAWVNVNELPEVDAAKMREEVNTVISDKLSFIFSSALS